MLDCCVYIDGSCRNNIGGTGSVIVHGGKIFKTYTWGPYSPTTNNKMEIMALLNILKILPNIHDYTIYSDSTYLVNGYNFWLKAWVKNHWKKYNGKKILNVEYWQCLYKYPNLNLKWIKGHGSSYYNNLADKLAKKITIAIEGVKPTTPEV